MAIGITGSTFIPLAIPQLVEEYFDLILEKVGQIKDLFEQSFFLMVHLPIPTIPLNKKNLLPVWLIDLPEDIYAQDIYQPDSINNVH